MESIFCRSSFDLKLRRLGVHFLKKNIMRRGFFHQNQKGFTLLELISIMIIIGVISSVAIKKVDFITDTASAQALELAVKELNIRETLTWTNIKLSKDGWIDDSAVFAAVDTDLGPQYNWKPKAEITGGELHFKSTKISLLRTASSNVSVSMWR